MVSLTATPVVQPGRPLSMTNSLAQPFVGPGYRSDDGKPVFVCAVASFGSYLTAVQIQAAGIDEANGFHLAIVPYELNPDYSIAQSDTESNMRSGAWDCELSTIDSIARSGYGVVTGVIDESAGGDGMYARNMTSIYDLRGKRITYEAGTSAEYFVHYALFISQISPRDVVLVPKDGAIEAVKAFNDREADVISLYDPYLAETVVAGGKPLVLSDQLRVVLDVLAMSRPALANKSKAVQAFHNAWFDALKHQTEDYDGAAAQIAAWGINDWSGISVANAADDLKGAMKVIAQAGLDANVALFKSPETLLSAMRTARDVWRTQHTVSDEPLETLIDGSFVNEAARSGVRLADAKPLNNSFSLVALTGDAANGEYTLPCQQYTFTPNSIKLTVESRHVLDLCVLPVLQQRPSVRLRITGSAAWPGPKGAFDEATVRAYARQRADAVAAYLVEKGITRDRLTITETLPPAERRGINNEVEQTKDRFVRMELLFGGF